MRLVSDVVHVATCSVHKHGLAFHAMIVGAWHVYTQERVLYMQAATSLLGANSISLNLERVSPCDLNKRSFLLIIFIDLLVRYRAEYIYSYESN